MVEHGITSPSQPAQRGQRSSFGWMSAHHRVLAMLVVAAAVLAGLGLGVSFGTAVLLGVVLICPLMMLGMMFGMKGMHGSHHARDGGDAAVDILRERYARGELTQEEYDRMRRDLS